ncbi:MAG TPA: 5'-nucleotidase C-terminal domain-containing protein [Candidatus Coprenecus stercoravium]|uniref:5'-nucleotidase C-terminal domain-containing protein n=1 Tax=Candidatus Coprenecus stercoravium TaxID=2840735 RepID=A0A9D2GSG3_9BACT|nr:5'-nucleotidase C-terminal domain-containing protein [Candidatus Coprenecus stercoravium]
MLRKRAIVLVLAVAALQSLGAQDFEYKWRRVRMDSTWESGALYSVDSIVAAHQEQIQPLMEVVIYSSEEIRDRRPESALSNLAADILLYAAGDRPDSGLPALSLMNFGGIRSGLPKGGVRIFDVYSAFPFDNTVVVARMRGEDVRRILDKFASSGKFEALGGVGITVRDGRMKRCLIGGRELEDDALYDLVTIDFLLDSGDRFDIAEDAVSVYRTGIVFRDAAVDYLRRLSSAGVVLENRGDGRVTIEDR